MRHSTIAIIGAGNVGTTSAYALMLKNLAPEILLVDIEKGKCSGEVCDLSDALPFSQSFAVKQASLKQAGQADIIVITAGVAQKPGETRIDLLKTNAAIIGDIVEGMKPIQPHAIILVVSNPVDILTLVVKTLSGLPQQQVIGSGTLLDTQRLRGEISEKMHISEQSIHAYILGEHGNSQFVPWSIANIVGVPLAQFLPQEELLLMAEKTMNTAYEIIRAKGSTYYGIGACVAEICEAIIFNQHRVMPISSYHQDLGVCLSLPTVLGENGVEDVIAIPFTLEEKKQLAHSVESLTLYNQSLHTP